jgi:hypothetical protein
LLDSISHERPLAQIITAKEYHSALLQDSTIPSCISRITDLQWSMFWSFTLTAVPRNIVYRYIIGKIPHRSLLHRVIPQSFLSNMCPICCIYIENADHLLFTCPSKPNIWKAIIFEFLWPTIEIEDIIQAITSLDFSNVNYSQKSDISAPNIIFLTLAQIWKAHYRYIFDDTPFQFTPIMGLIRENICRYREETLVYRRQDL